MTSERRIIVSLKDIKLVSYECKKCSAKVSFAPDSALDATERCFQCRAEWRKDSPLSDDYQVPGMARQAPTMRLMRSIADMRNPDIVETLGFRILLEFDEPTMQSVSQK